jgi:ribonuclease HII
MPRKLPPKKPFPDYSLEIQAGGRVCGIDEAGRGPLAGPVLAAAVIWENPERIPQGLNDSKKLSRAQRENLFEAVIERAVVGIGEATVEEIEIHNILGATRIAMQRAYCDLAIAASTALVDGNQPPVLSCRTIAVVGGDARSLSIAAASIIAKVTRDRIMETLGQQYPEYGFERHAGYGTAHHLEALQRVGPCPAHRRGFAPIRDLLAAIKAA